jgi:hypothetical protein
MTTVQTLPLTLGIDPKRRPVTDALRRKRNIANYTGDDIDDSSVAHCIEEAERLVDDLDQWRESHQPNPLPTNQ